MDIEKVDNGYIVNYKTTITNITNVYNNIEEVMEEMLRHFEGRSKNFGEDMYGCVQVFRYPGETYTSPKEVEPA